MNLFYYSGSHIDERHRVSTGYARSLLPVILSICAIMAHVNVLYNMYDHVRTV